MEEKELSLPEYFLLGAKKGLFITLEVIAPAMVMALCPGGGAEDRRCDAAHRDAPFAGDGGLRAPRRGVGGAPGGVLREGCRRGHGGFHVRAGHPHGGAGDDPFPGVHHHGDAVRALYYPVLLAMPVVDAVIVMLLTRAVLALYL